MVNPRTCSLSFPSTLLVGRSRPCRALIVAFGLIMAFGDARDMHAQNFRSRPSYAPPPLPPRVYVPGYGPSQPYRPPQPSRAAYPPLPRRVYVPGYGPTQPYRPPQPSRTAYPPLPPRMYVPGHAPSRSNPPGPIYNPNQPPSPRPTYGPSPQYRPPQPPAPTYRRLQSYTPPPTYTSPQTNKQASDKRLTGIAVSGAKTVRSLLTGSVPGVIKNAATFTSGVIKEAPYVANPQNYGINYPQVPLNASSRPAPTPLKQKKAPWLPAR
jgi:hypothetical protein